MNPAKKKYAITVADHYRTYSWKETLTIEKSAKGGF